MKYHWLKSGKAEKTVNLLYLTEQLDGVSNYKQHVLGQTNKKESEEEVSESITDVLTAFQLGLVEFQTRFRRSRK